MNKSKRIGCFLVFLLVLSLFCSVMASNGKTTSCTGEEFTTMIADNEQVSSDTQASWEAVPHEYRDAAPIAEAGTTDVAGTFPRYVDGQDMNGRTVTVRYCRVTFDPSTQENIDRTMEYVSDDSADAARAGIGDGSTLSVSFNDEVDENDYIEITYTFYANDDGTVVAKRTVPDDIDQVKGRIKMTSMKLNDEEYTVLGNGAAYMEAGGSKLPPEVMKTPPVPSNESGKAGVNITPSNIPFKDLAGEVMGSIDGTPYNVLEAIPTSENLKYGISAQKALYDINARMWSVYAWVEQPYISALASYEYDEEDGEWVDQKDKRGRVIGREWKGKGTYHKEIAYIRTMWNICG